VLTKLVHNPRYEVYNIYEYTNPFFTYFTLNSGLVGLWFTKYKEAGIFVQELSQLQMCLCDVAQIESHVNTSKVHKVLLSDKNQTPRYL